MENLNTNRNQIGGICCGSYIATVKNKFAATSIVTDVQVDLPNQEAETTGLQTTKADELYERLSYTTYSIFEDKDPLFI